MKKLFLTLALIGITSCTVPTFGSAPSPSGTDKELAEYPSYGTFLLYRGTEAAITSLVGYFLIKTATREFKEITDPTAQSASETATGSKETTISKICPGIKSTTKLSSIIGTKPLEFEQIIKMIDQPEIFKKLKAPFPKGLFMHGAPGTGKTILARGLANKLNATYFEIVGSQLESKWYGQTSKNIGNLFKQAREAAPAFNSQGIYAVIFIDELESIAPNRKGNVQHHTIQSVDALLSEMTKDENKHILIIGASNHKDKVDAGILRSGRFDIHINVPLPDMITRGLILEHYAKDLELEKELDPKCLKELEDLGLDKLKKGYSSQYPHLFKPKINFAQLAQRTSGFSGADLKELCSKASRLAADARLSCVKQESFEAARVLMQQNHEATLKANSY